MEQSKETKKELQSIEALHGDLELMLESATSFLNDNDRSMMKIAESTRRIPKMCSSGQNFSCSMLRKDVNGNKSRR